MDNATYWDAAAGNKAFTLKFELEEFTAKLPEHAAILDVGCGYGRTLIELHNAGIGKLYGCDSSLEMVKQARQKLPEAEFKVNQYSTLPYPDNTFGAVILLAVLTAIIDDKAQDELMREIARVLLPGGLVYIGDFLLNDDARNLQRYEAGRSINGTYGVFKLDEGVCLRHHSPDYTTTLLKKYFTGSFRYVSHKTMNGHQSKGFYFLGENRK